MDNKVRVYPNGPLDRPGLIGEKVGIGHYRVTYISQDTGLPVSAVLSADQIIYGWDERRTK